MGSVPETGREEGDRRKRDYHSSDKTKIYQRLARETGGIIAGDSSWEITELRWKEEMHRSSSSDLGFSAARKSEAELEVLKAVEEHPEKLMPVLMLFP